MIRSLLLWASTNPWMAGHLPRRRFVQRAVRRFMPGETRGAALDAAEGLSERGIGTVFTLLGENVLTPAEVEAVLQEYLSLLREIGARGLDAEISVKPTQLGLDLDRAVALEAVVRLAGAAAAGGSFTWIDMEATPYLEATLELFREASREGASVGLCLQAYLRSTPEDLDDLLQLQPTIRMVKGAYAEPPSLAFPKKRDVDEAYFHLVTKILSSGGRVGVATHDPALVGRIRAWVEEEGIDKGRYEFQMLYGIQSGAQDRLSEAGEPIRVLISYGPSWFPWYMRRLAERPANLWFVVKNVFSR